MQAETYYTAINKASQEVFTKSIGSCDFLGNIHDYSTALQDWIQVIPNDLEVQILNHSIEQVEISCLSLLSGIYRQSFASLRLSLELLFGSTYFSASKLELVEWMKGSRDLNWKTINDQDNGVLSKRFSNAFFPELSNYVSEERNKATMLYRELSEFVHGNYSTWNLERPSLSLNKDLIVQYERNFKSFSSISQFLLCVRYLKQLDQEKLSKVEPHIMDELRHITEIRAVFGGSIGE